MELDEKIEKYKADLTAEKMKPPKIVEKIVEKTVYIEDAKREVIKVHDGKDYSHLLDLNLLIEHEFESFMKSLDILSHDEEFSVDDI